MQRSQYIQKQAEDGIRQSKEAFNSQNTDTKVNKHKGLNRESLFLFFEYFFNYAGVNCKNIEKAKVIERLSGYSHKKTVSLFSWFEKEKFETEEKREARRKFFEDMGFARECFELLGLTEVVEKIDEDLGDE